jgi:hypothetical protein
MILSIKSLSFFILVVVLLLFAGCVTRTITIKTNPSNALVYVDNELVGESPVTVPFTYYGTRKITIEKKDADGRLMCERKIVFEKIKTPVYEMFPLDFFSEIIWPLDIQDNHVFNYDLVELKPLSRKEQQKTVIENAEELRQRVAAPDF